MKGRKKKLVVWLLALSMLVSSGPGLNVAAAGPGTVTTADNASGDAGLDSEDADQTDGDQAAGQEPADQNADLSDSMDSANSDQQQGTDVTLDSDGTKVQDGAEDSKKPAEDAESAESEEEKEEESEEVQEGLINYLVVGQAEMQAPGEQSVIVSYGDGTEEISSVKLVLTGEDGKQIEIPLTEKQEASYRFVKAFGESEAGVYKLTRFAYEADGHKKYIELEKIGISAQFTVQAGAVASAAEESTEEPGISVMTLTSDDISDDMTSDIEATIQEAADQAVEDVIEGAVELGASSTEQSYSKAGVSKTATAAVDDAIKLGSYSAPKAYTGTVSSVVVVLDPGHGGSDEGATASSNGLKEKDINLKIAQYCKAELERHDGVTVYMTRTTDKYVGLEDRVEAAKLMGATLFVSIHMNSAQSEDAKGAEVYYPNSNYNPAVGSEGKAAAQSILNELVELGLSNRGVKFLNATNNNDGEGVYADGSTADYYSVIRNSKKNGFPGIIVEHAFLSNEDDAKQLESETFLKQLGQADAQGILKYCETKTDYSSVYDYTYYVSRYSDVRRAYGGNPVGALQHFINYGMKEGRQASKEFSADAYKNRYSDLRTAFGNNYQLYYMHYINFGKKEGRIATADGSNVNSGSNAGSNVPNNTATNTVYAGMDYGDVYDYEYYINRYSDLAAVFSGDYAGALKHFVTNGMREGRQAKGTFNVVAYRNNYRTDFRNHFANNMAAYDNWEWYFMHYIEYGKAEGRSGLPLSGTDDPDDDTVKGTTQYGLVDYKDVYDFEYYVSKYSDIRKAYGNNPDKALQHFIRHGMDEGRQGNSEFNVYGYRSRYSDLRSAFGNNMKQYYLHYINHGKKEGRKTDLVAVTTYQGTDYSKVYNFDYYTKRYSDLNQAFANDPAGAIQHFIQHGVSEGRQACEGFSITAYKNNNSDLRRAFGDNDMAYIRHYITLGYGEENRNPSSPILHAIKGTSTTSVNQMVMYFLANAPYPSYYANNTNVKTINDFCKLYYDICEDYGIKAEVAFCQAMKETNFLKFGGDVKQTQFNFAGLGATGNSVSGASFNSIEEGIRAHIQHLYAYADKNASEASIKAIEGKGDKSLVDPRFQFVTKGSAINVEHLGQKENPIPGLGWATAERYGYSIVENYMNKLEMY